MPKRPSIAIVIVTWNAKAYTMECLESLTKNTDGFEPRIIVVDNDSADGTPEAVEAHFPSVQLVRTGANLGFAKGNNVGLKLCDDADYVCLINSDVVVPPNCFAPMISYMEQHPDVGMLGPKMAAPGGGVGDSVMSYPTVWNSFCSALGLHRVFKKSKWFGGYMMRGFTYDTTTDVDVLTGWFWVVRNSALQQVGGLDEQFFMYGEDIDWPFRFRKAGWRVVYFADAWALHYGAASSKAAPARFYIEMKRANLQYFKKHHGRRGELGYRAVLLVHEIARITGHGLVYLFVRSRRPQAKQKVSTSLSCFGWLAGVTAAPHAR